MPWITPRLWKVDRACYAYNLDSSMSRQNLERELKHMFGSYGYVNHIVFNTKVIENIHGYGAIIYFSHRSMAQVACRQLHNTSISPVSNHPHIVTEKVDYGAMGKLPLPLHVRMLENHWVPWRTVEASYDFFRSTGDYLHDNQSKKKRARRN